MNPTVIGLSYASPVRPLYRVVFPSRWMSRPPSPYSSWGDSGVRFSRMFWMVGCFLAPSSSSQYAPSNTGVAMSFAGGVAGRVLLSERTGSSPTLPDFSVSQPQRAA